MCSRWRDHKAKVPYRLISGGDARGEVKSYSNSLMRRVDDSAADHGAQYFDARVLARFNFGQVIGQHDEVSEFSGLQFALLPFHEFAVSRSGRVCANAISERNLFLRFPAVFGPAVRQLARHARVESPERADRFDIVIRSKR